MVRISGPAAKLGDLSIGSYATNQRRTIAFQVIGHAERSEQDYVVKVLGRLVKNQDGYNIYEGKTRDTISVMQGRTTIYPISLES